MPPRLSVIIPTLNAAEELGGCLAALVPAVVNGLVQDVIITDGHSTDATREIAADMGASILDSPKGRATQMNVGAKSARGDWLLFLHADSWLGYGWASATQRHMMETPEDAGYFTLAYRSNVAHAKWLAARANRRANWLGLPYGDQGLLMPKALYRALDGFAELPLMEDVDIVKRLGKRRLKAINATIHTSAKKYERDGWRKRAYSNAWLLTRYLCGTSPAKLAKIYD